MSLFTEVKLSNPRASPLTSKIKKTVVPELWAKKPAAKFLVFYAYYNCLKINNYLKLQLPETTIT